MVHVMSSCFKHTTVKVIRAALRGLGLHTRFPFPAPETGQKALEIGAGHHRVKGYETHEMINVGDPPPHHIFDLDVRPWPLSSNNYDIVVIRNVLEHLNDTVGPMEEIYRICRHGARVLVRVPHWHSSTAFVDPTHRRFFDFRTFMFFDKQSRLGMQRSYYSAVDFRFERRWLNVLGLPIDSSNPFLNGLLAVMAQCMGGMVHGMTFFLRVEKIAANVVDKR